MTVPAKVLMTVDAVGGVWRYAMDLAAALRPRGIKFVFTGFGPEPSREQAAEAADLGKLLWLDQPLDWMVAQPRELAGVASALEKAAFREGVDLLHLNLPSQAAGLSAAWPVVAVSHSCVATWFRAVRGTDCPPDWAWQKQANQAGFARADAVLAPSRSHAALVAECYGAIPHLQTVFNASAPHKGAPEPKRPYVLAAGRWWDEGKNGAVLDAAAQHVAWPVKMAGPVRGPNGQSIAFSHAKTLGNLPAADLAVRMAEAAIFCSPSLFEPFGLAVLEAAQAGAGLVLADIPTFRELWEGAALFADPRSPQAFSASISRLINDAGLRGELAAAARTSAGRFSLAAQADGMGEVYAALMPARTKRAAG